MYNFWVAIYANQKGICFFAIFHVGLFLRRLIKKYRYIWSNPHINTQAITSSYSYSGHYWFYTNWNHRTTPNLKSRIKFNRIIIPNTQIERRGYSFQERTQPGKHHSINERPRHKLLACWAGLPDQWSTVYCSRSSRWAGRKRRWTGEMRQTGWISVTRKGKPFRRLPDDFWYSWLLHKGSKNSFELF